MQIIDGIPVWGVPLENALVQARNCLKTARAVALMADHHQGYAVPVGGVVAYKNEVSPSGVGFDIACGNKAIQLDMPPRDAQASIKTIMDDVWRQISFGVGRKNKNPIDHELFDDPAWEIPAAAVLKQLAQEQLGTVGSGNHYVDVFCGSDFKVWVGVHFGSRGLGHKMATYYINAAGGKDGINVDPCILSTETDLGREYVACMELAGRYAYAGRDYVCSTVARILGAPILDEVHNHHNFAWKEVHGGETLWVVRKGATPAFPGQLGFVGGTMGENSVILRGVDHPDAKFALNSTVHGAGRAMSRTEAAGKSKWVGGQKIRVSDGKVSQAMMDEWVKGRAKVELRGGGLDESPHAYKRLDEVLASHANTIEILTTLTPMGVAMAGSGEIDLYKD